MCVSLVPAPQRNKTPKKAVIMEALRTLLVDADTTTENNAPAINYADSPDTSDSEYEYNY